LQIAFHDVGRQILWVGVRRGIRPSLLIFKEIGANIELIEPLLVALKGREAIGFDVRSGRSSAPWVPLSAMEPSVAVRKRTAGFEASADRSRLVVAGCRSPM
jgi:hypothetical protein